MKDPKLDDIAQVQNRYERFADERSAADISRSRDKHAYYEAAVAIFDNNKGGKATPVQREKLWNAAECEAVAKEHPVADGPTHRTRRVCAGDLWLPP